jgi:hypothetical protein
MSIKEAVEDFTQRLRAIIEGQAMERTKAAVLDAFGLNAPKRRGRPPKALSGTPASAKGPGKNASKTGDKPNKRRKKPPLQLCPVPGCKSPAAPVFGMVCAQHKNVAKSKIRKYREARKAQKQGLQPAKRISAKRISAKRSAKKAAAVKAKMRTKVVPKAASEHLPKKARSKDVATTVSMRSAPSAPPPPPVAATPPA